MATQLLHVSSEDSANKQLVTVHFTDPSRLAFKPRSVEVVNVHVPQTFYNVHSGNNLLKWQVFAGALLSSYETNITPGLYTLPELMAAVQAAMVVYDATTTVVQLDNTMKVQVDAADEFRIQASGIWRLLGFEATTGQDADPKTGEHVPDVYRGRHAVHVALSWTPVHQPVIAGVGTKPFLVRVPTASFGEFVDHQPRQTLRYGVSADPGTLTMSLWDEDGVAVDLNGLDWSVTLMLSE